MTKRSATTFLALLTLASAASTASTPPAGAAAAAPCGIGEPVEGDSGEQVYLTAITHRKNVTCAVASKAAKGVSDVKLCKKKMSAARYGNRARAPRR